MKRRIWLLLFIIPVVSVMSHGAALAITIDFTIEGTYGETLINGEGGTVFSMGDGFNIQGKYDTGQQPLLETASDDNDTLQDESLDLMPLFSYIIDYSKIVDLTFTDISLDLINSDYPSEGDVFSDDDIKNGSYMVYSMISYLGNVTEGSTFSVINNYTELTVKDRAGVFDAYISYNYHKEIEQQGKFTIVRIVNDTIPLNITKFQITDNLTPVPEPSTILLFGSGLIGLVAFRRFFCRTQ